MNLNDLKFGDVMELINMLKGSKAQSKPHPSLGKYVVVRTYAAGVHVGVLKDYDYITRHAVLTDSRRIWSWEGAFTLSAVAVDGITGGRIAIPLDEIMIAQVEEIIPCSSVAESNLRGKEVHKP